MNENMVFSRVVLSTLCFYVTCLGHVRGAASIGSRAVFAPPGLDIAKTTGEQPILHFMQTNPGSYDYVPRPKDLKTKRLLRRLGTNFNPKFMSVDKPEDSYLESTKNTFQPNAHLYSELDSLNYTFVNNKGQAVTLRPKIVKMMKRWLIQRSSCQVHFKWYDLGVFFWPRWIKHGSCSTDTLCSFPSGMHCVPSESKRLTLLRWRCRDKRTPRILNNRLNPDPPPVRNNRHKRRCKWRKIPFPVLDQCHCSC